MVAESGVAQKTARTVDAVRRNRRAVAGTSKVGCVHDGVAERSLAAQLGFGGEELVPDAGGKKILPAVRVNNPMQIQP